jgi:hypothetical protein
MDIRIAIVGPEDSVEKIKRVTKEFPEATFEAFTYEKHSELDKILKENANHYDQWYFSGILNYSYVIENKLIDQERAIYPKLYGSSFLETLLEAQVHRGKIYQSFSVDVVNTEEMRNVLDFGNLNKLTFYNSPWKGYQYISDLITFHKEQYESGRTEIAITSIREICMALQKEGIPAYRATPSYLAIRLSLELLIERAQTNRYMNAQMAIIGFLGKFNAREKDDLHYSFKLKDKEIELTRDLLHFTERVNGSFMQLGDGRYFIFTTRGELGPEREKELFTVIDNVKQQYNIDLVVSIGYGETALQAEHHVRYGFHHGESDKSITIVDDDHSIVVRNAEDLDFSYRPVHVGKAWVNKLNNVSPTVVAKIEAYTQQYGKHEFSSQDVARWIQSTDRNGRRVVSEMQKAGILEVCGEMQLGSRGRPRKLYRFVDTV